MQTTAPNPVAGAAYNNILNQAQSVAATPWQNYGGEFVAPVNQQQYTGISNINQYAQYALPTLGIAQNMAWNAAQPITQADIQQYQNPWTQDVINATAAQFSNQNAQQLQNVRGNAIAQGALGGDREAVAEAELTNQENLAQAPVIAGLESQGYTQGVNTALTEQQALASGAYSLGNLGVAAQNAGLGGAGAQIQAGGLEQQTQQQQDTALYNQWLASRAYPFQTTQWEAGIDTGVGSQMGGTSTTTAPSPSPWSQLAGLGIAGTSILGGTGAFSGQNGQSGWLAPAISGLGSSISSALPSASWLMAAGLPLGVHRGGRVAGYDSGGGVSPLPYASGGPWEPYAGGRGWVPVANMTHGQGLPRPPQPPQQPDSMHLGEQVAGLAKYFNTGRQPGPGLPAAGSGPDWAQPNSPLMTGYSPSQGVAPSPGQGSAGWADAGSPLMIGYGGTPPSPWANGGVVRGYADGGMPQLPDDLSDLVSPTASTRSGLEGLAQTYAPALHDYFTAERPPPPTTPNAVGKLPTRDPYAEPALEEGVGYGLMALPFGRAASLGLRGAEEIGARGAMRTLGDFGTSVPMPVRRGVAAGVAGAGAASLPDVAQAFDTLGPRPTISTDEQAQIDRLNREITGLTNQRAAATKGMGPKGASVQAQAFDTQIGQRNTSIRAIMDQVAARQQTYDERLADFAKKTAPFATREPEWNAALTAAPVASFGSGALLGSLAGRKVAPIKRAMTYGAAGLGGGLEGLIGGYYPTYADLKMPEGSVARTQAQAHEEDPKFWEHGVAPEVGMSAATALLGAKFGMLRREPRVVSQGVAGQATLPELPSRAWATNPDGSRKWPSGPNDPLMKSIDVKPKKGGGFYDANTGHTLPANLWPKQPSGKVVPMHAAEANGGAVRGYQVGGSPAADGALTDDLVYRGELAGVDNLLQNPIYRLDMGATPQNISNFVQPLTGVAPSSNGLGSAAQGNFRVPGRPTAAEADAWAAAHPATFAPGMQTVGPGGVTSGPAPYGYGPEDRPGATAAQWATYEATGRPIPHDALPVSYRSNGAMPSYRSNGIAGGGGDYVPLSPAPGQGGAAPQSGIDLSSNSKLWPSLMAAGFGMMASRSPYPLQAVGEGALTGMGAYTKASELESARAMKQSEIDIQAQKLWQQNENERKKLALTMATPHVIGQDEFGRQQYGQIGPDGRIVPINPQQQGAPFQTPGATGQPGAGVHMISDWRVLSQDEEQQRASIIRSAESTDSGTGLDPTNATPTDRIVAPEPRSFTDGAGPHGDDFLKTLPDQSYANTVRLYALGRMPWPSGYAQRVPYFQKLSRDVAQYDPNFNAQRYNTFAEFAYKKAAQNATSFNTAISHAGQMDEDIDALKNTNYPIYNTLKNIGKSQYDPATQSALKNFQADKTALTEELTRAFRMSGGNVHDIQEWAKVLNDADSPESLHSAVQKAMKLLRGRIDALGDQYNRGMGITRDPLQLLSPQAEQAFRRLSAGQRATAPAATKPPPAATAQPAPTAAQPAPIEQALPPGAPPGSRRAKDGKIYHPDPDRPGKYMEWTP